MTVGLWALVAAGLMVSRLPTLSFKTVRVSPNYVAPLLVLVGLAAAVLITAPFLALAVGAVGYLALLPYTIYRYRWLARHPEAWDVPLRERRAVARAARSARRLGLRPPLRRRVAGRASAVARAVRRFGPDDATGAAPRRRDGADTPRRRDRADPPGRRDGADPPGRRDGAEAPGPAGDPRGGTGSGWGCAGSAAAEGRRTRS